MPPPKNDRAAWWKFGPRESGSHCAFYYYSIFSRGLLRIFKPIKPHFGWENQGKLIRNKPHSGMKMLRSQSFNPPPLSARAGIFYTPERMERVRRRGKERLGEFNSCQKDPRARHIMYPYVLANLAGRCVFVVSQQRWISHSDCVHLSASLFFQVGSGAKFYIQIKILQQREFFNFPPFV